MLFGKAKIKINIRTGMRMLLAGLGSIRFRSAGKKWGLRVKRFYISVERKPSTDFHWLPE